MTEIPTNATSTITPPPAPAFKNPQQALYAALAAAFLQSAVPVVERHFPGPNRGTEKMGAVATAFNDFILNAAPLAEFVPHTNPLTAFLTNVAIQGAYNYALQNGQVTSSTAPANPVQATPATTATTTATGGQG